MSLRGELLQEAIGLIDGDRNEHYGDPLSDFNMSADLWQTYLERTIEARGSLKLMAHDVAALMILVKVSRMAWTPDKKDHWADIAGYAGCGFDCAVRENHNG